MLHTETIEAGTLALLKKLTNDKELEKFSLAGGTALALQFGHRKSIDIDLFTEQDFDAEKLAAHLSAHYPVERIAHKNNGVACYIEGVKIDILAHQYPLINKVVRLDNIPMYSLEDIAAMKLNAIVYNGTRIKDFVDIHKLLEHLSLQKMTDAFTKKYPDVTSHMVQSGLQYHEDINRKDKVDYMDKDILFEKITERLLQAVNDPAKKFKLELKIEQHKKPIQKQEQKPKLIQKRKPGRDKGLMH